MVPAGTSVEQLDRDISVAWTALGVARAAFERCPSGENERRVTEAEGTVDQLLDTRLAARV